MKYIFETRKDNEGNYVIEVSLQGNNNSFNASQKRTVSCFLEPELFHYSESLEDTLISLINDTRLTVKEREEAINDADTFAIYCHGSVPASAYQTNNEQETEQSNNE